MRERRVRTRGRGLLLLAAVALVLVAGVAGYALGAPHRAPPLQTVTLPAQQVDIGNLGGSVSIGTLCARTCAPGS